jgi:hypothetical protein
MTGQHGVYAFPDLPIGAYELSVNHPGFMIQRARHHQLHLGRAQHTELAQRGDAHRELSTFELSNNLSKTAGRHIIKTAVYYFYAGNYEQKFGPQTNASFAAHAEPGQDQRAGTGRGRCQSRKPGQRRAAVPGIEQHQLPGKLRFEPLPLDAGQFQPAHLGQTDARGGLYLGGKFLETEEVVQISWLPPQLAASAFVLGCPGPILSRSA